MKWTTGLLSFFAYCHWRARIFPSRRLPFPFGVKVPRRLLDRSGAIHMLAQKEILWLKHPVNSRALILKRAMKSKTWAMGKCFWDTRLASQFLWPNEAMIFSPSVRRAHITEDH